MNNIQQKRILQERHEAELEDGRQHVHQLHESEVQIKTEQVEAKDDLIHQLQNGIATKNNQLEGLSRQMEVSDCVY